MATHDNSNAGPAARTRPPPFRAADRPHAPRQFFLPSHRPVPLTSAHVQPPTPHPGRVSRHNHLVAEPDRRQPQHVGETRPAAGRADPRSDPSHQASLRPSRRPHRGRAVHAAPPFGHAARTHPQAAPRPQSAAAKVCLDGPAGAGNRGLRLAIAEPAAAARDGGADAGRPRRDASRASPALPHAGGPPAADPGAASLPRPKPPSPAALAEPAKPPAGRRPKKPEKPRYVFGLRYPPPFPDPA